MTSTLCGVLTAKEAAARARVSVKTLDRWQRAGLITPDYTPGGKRRFTEQDVDALITRRGGQDDSTT